MRDDQPYAGMAPAELRAELVRVSQQLASWEYAAANQRAELVVPFYEAYEASAGKSVAERVREAEMATARARAILLESEGQVAFWRAIRDCIVELVRHPETVLVGDGNGGVHAVPAPPLLTSSS